MTPHPVDHINLLQRSGPTYTVVWWLMGVLVLALAVVGYLGTQLWSNARQAQRDRDAVTSQLPNNIAGPTSGQ